MRESLRRCRIIFYRASSLYQNKLWDCFCASSDIQLFKYRYLMCLITVKYIEKWMNGYIHICLLVAFLSPSILYIQKSWTELHTKLFPENSVFFFSTQWNGSTSYPVVNTIVSSLSPCCFPLCMPSPHLFCLLYHIPVQTLLSFCKGS